RNAVESGFSSDVRDSVWIFSRQTSLPYMGLGVNRQIRFTVADANAIAREIPGVWYISSENPLAGAITNRYKDRTNSAGVFGAGDNYFQIKKYQDLLQGRTLNSFDEQQIRKVASIGKSVAEELFPNEDPLGKSIEINGVNFKVIG